MNAAAKIDLPSTVVEALHGRLGRGVQSWIDQDLPLIVQECQDKWGLEVGVALEGGCTAAVLGASQDNKPCVLKVHPDPDLFDAEFHGWQLWSDSGMPTLLESDGQHKVLLQERVIPGTELVEIKERAIAAAAAADLLADLHAHSAPTQFKDLSERVSGWLERSQALATKAAEAPHSVHVPPDVFTYAHKVAAELMTNQHHDTALHGDFYPDNILWNEKHHRWQAIDPEPCRGDPSFDAATWSYAYGRGAHLEANTEQFATRLGLPTDRIKAWAYVVAVINLPLRAAYGRTTPAEVASGLAVINNPPAVSGAELPHASQFAPTAAGPQGHTSSKPCSPSARTPVRKQGGNGRIR